MNHNHINWDALINFISGQCSSAEEEMIHEWMKLDPKNEKFIGFLKKLWDTSAERKTSWEVDSAWNKFNEEYQVVEHAEEPEVRSPSPAVSQKPFLKSIPRARQWYSWAAVVAAVAIVIAVVYSLDLHSDTPRMASEVQEPAFREIVTNNGQRTHLILSDGSKVIINAGSKLVLPETFGITGPREIHLSGEAWFEVDHNPSQPFIVYTEDAATTVLGTKFQVRSYPDDEDVEVVVAEGKVALQDNERMDQLGATITRNQIGVFKGKSGSTTVSRIRDLSPYLGWKEGNLVFAQEPLNQVVKDLQRWYDVEIQIDPSKPSLNRKELTASFTENQPIAEVLEAIALTLDVQYRKADDKFAFYFF